MINIQKMIEEANKNGYPLADEAIDAFIGKLNCLEGIKISRLGKIEELKQPDYSGKQVFILIEDLDGNQVRSKIDLGVHNRFELERKSIALILRMMMKVPAC